MQLSKQRSGPLNTIALTVSHLTCRPFHRDWQRSQESPTSRSPYKDTILSTPNRKRIVAVQLAAVEEALAARKTELEEVLASHKAVQLGKEQAKADLALVAQQLRGGRAARDAELQQHSALVSSLLTTAAGQLQGVYGVGNMLHARMHACSKVREALAAAMSADGLQAPLCPCHGLTLMPTLHWYAGRNLTACIWLAINGHVVQ